MYTTTTHFLEWRMSSRDGDIVIHLSYKPIQQQKTRAVHIPVARKVNNDQRLAAKNQPSLSPEQREQQRRRRNAARRRQKQRAADGANTKLDVVNVHDVTVSIYT